MLELSPETLLSRAVGRTILVDGEEEVWKEAGEVQGVFREGGGRLKEVGEVLNDGEKKGKWWEREGEEESKGDLTIFKSVSSGSLPGLRLLGRDGGGRKRERERERFEKATRRD